MALRNWSFGSRSARRQRPVDVGTYPPPVPERVFLRDAPEAKAKRKTAGATACKAPKGQEVICASQSGRYDSLLVDVCLVRQNKSAPLVQVRGGLDAVNEAVRLLRDTQNNAREVFVVFYLDAMNQIIGARTSDGGRAETMIDPSDVLRAGLLLGCFRVIYAHNHPSGQVRPSVADHNVTRHLIETFGTVGISTIDSIVVGPETQAHDRMSYFSMRENNSEYRHAFVQ